MTDQPLKPRIYVACLAAQLEGAAHGAWISVDGDAWQLWEGVRDMLLASPAANADAFAIQDYEGFGAASISAFAGLDAVAMLAASQSQ